MNHNSMLKHYRMIKYIQQATVLLDQSDSTEIKHRMMWDLGDVNDTHSLRLFYTRGSNEFIVMIMNNETHNGNTILKTHLAENNGYYSPENYLTGKSLVLSGKKTTLRFTEKNAHEAIELESLPVEAGGSLIVRDEMEELEFQHSTVTAFDGHSFGLYCIFSLLNIVDNMFDGYVAKNEKKYDQYINLPTVVDDSIIDEVESKIVTFVQNLKEDI
jgi:hypothetical protein